MVSFMESRGHALFLAQSAVMSTPLCQWLRNWSLWFGSASTWAQTVPSSWGTSSQKQTLKRKRTLKRYCSLYGSGGVNTLQSEKRSRFSIRRNGEKLPTVGKIRKVRFPTHHLHMPFRRLRGLVLPKHPFCIMRVVPKRVVGKNAGARVPQPKFESWVFRFLDVGNWQVIHLSEP